MSLKKLLNRKSAVILGLNSGTSADGVDMAAVRISREGSRSKITLLAGQTKKYPSELKRLIIKASSVERIAPESLIQLDQVLGKFCGKCANSFINRLKRKDIRIDAVASHGQTVRHQPRKVKVGTFPVSGTMQVGSAEQIATQTGKVVISDFRQADVALGNEGAPITVSAMAEMFSRLDRSTMIVNIGGIANYFYFPSAESGLPVRAADAGPGNSLSDLLSLELFGDPYDINGRRAAKGQVSGRLISVLGAHPFFRGGSVSTGREEFGFEMAEDIIDFGKRFELKGEDLLATVSDLTARTIATAVKPIFKKDKALTKLYLTGGGVRNRFIRDRLGTHLPNTAIGSVSELGMDPDLVEAAAFAVMGMATLESRPMRTVFSGRKKQTLRPVSGRIVQPPAKV